MSEFEMLIRGLFPKSPEELTLAEGEVVPPGDGEPGAPTKYPTKKGVKNYEAWTASYCRWVVHCSERQAAARLAELRSLPAAGSYARWEQIIPPSDALDGIWAVTRVRVHELEPLSPIYVYLKRGRAILSNRPLEVGRKKGWKRLDFVPATARSLQAWEETLQALKREGWPGESCTAACVREDREFLRALREK